MDKVTHIQLRATDQFKERVRKSSNELNMSMSQYIVTCVNTVEKLLLDQNTLNIQD